MNDATEERLKVLTDDLVADISTRAKGQKPEAKKVLPKGVNPFTDEKVLVKAAPVVTGDQLVKRMRGNESGGMTPKIMALIPETKGRVDGVPHKVLDDLRVVERDKITGRPTKWSK